MTERLYRILGLFVGFGLLMLSFYWSHSEWIRYSSFVQVSAGFTTLTIMALLLIRNYLISNTVEVSSDDTQ